MLKEAIEFLQRSGKSEVIKVDGRDYILNGDRYEKVKSPILYDRFESCKLEGIVDYIKGDIDEGSYGNYVINIESPTRVTLKSGVMTENMDRAGLLTSNARIPVLANNAYLKSEDFIIELLSNYLDGADRKAVLALAGNIVEESEVATGDNGVSQRVMAKTGVVSTDIVEVQNPITLIPYRTFNEIEQPSGQFILRIKKGGYCALFNSGDVQWELDAIESIYNYLVLKLEKEIDMGAVKIIR